MVLIRQHLGVGIHIFSGGSFTKCIQGSIDFINKFFRLINIHNSVIFVKSIRLGMDIDGQTALPVGLRKFDDQTSVRFGRNDRCRISARNFKLMFWSGRRNLVNQLRRRNTHIDRTIHSRSCGKFDYIGCI